MRNCETFVICFETLLTHFYDVVATWSTVKSDPVILYGRTFALKNDDTSHHATSCFYTDLYNQICLKFYLFGKLIVDLLDSLLEESNFLLVENFSTCLIISFEMGVY